MIGISFYLNDPLAEERITMAGKMGVKRAFTSLHIPEESGDLAHRAMTLLQKAKECGIEVYADVSLRTPSHLGLASLFDLKNLGVIGLRLDDFFDNQTILNLAKEFKLALNASILFEAEVRALLDGGLKADQLLAWHNFYPRRDTGLSDSFFQKQNELFKKLDIPVCAYIPGDGEKRGPLFEGLPTLEEHRDLDSFMSALELFAYGIEDVYIGDPEASEDLLRKLIDFDQHDCVEVRIKGFQEGEFKLRPDFSRDVLRFMDTRSADPVVPENTTHRGIGSITMDNDTYGRYRGEVQITLCDLPADERVNVVGSVIEDDWLLLSYLKPGQKVKFIQV
ncbi:MupG family TIM beta-alpha barrel fold protein [Neobacillus vireti]|uniref:MupG family TIM beta-alpha barrel fold protein n=1 Tax=Neobacillus vireti TaxID=220686 RepID=UPI002FFF4450